MLASMYISAIFGLFLSLLVSEAATFGEPSLIAQHA